MSDNEINLAVARACGLPIHNKLPPGWESAEPFVLHSEMLGELRLSARTGSRFYDPRNDDAQAIAALERIAPEATLEWIDRVWYVSLEPMGRMAHGDAKLSVAVTGAILAAQRNSPD